MKVRVTGQPSGRLPFHVCLRRDHARNTGAARGDQLSEGAQSSLCGQLPQTHTAAGLSGELARRSLLAPRTSALPSVFGGGLVNAVPEESCGLVRAVGIKLNLLHILTTASGKPPAAACCSHAHRRRRAINLSTDAQETKRPK